MALRVLSGILKPRAGFTRSGSATIDFHPHSVAGDVDAVGAADSQALGPDMPFSSEPCKALSLRRIKLDDQDHSRPSEAVGVDTKVFDINDEYDRTLRNSLKVSWVANGRGAEILEISYMIIGNAG
jgi:hypothetical protein